jgi:hypothetical protein
MFISQQAAHFYELGEEWKDFLAFDMPYEMDMFFYVGGYRRLLSHFDYFI